MDCIIEQIKSLANDADDMARKTIMDQLRDVSISVETPQDAMQRICYTHLQSTLVRIGCDLKLFNILTENKEPLTVDQLANKTGADPTLLGRILRYLASVRTVKETGKDTFTANNITTYLANPGIQSGVYHNVDSIGPAMAALPDFLAEIKYQDYTDPTHTPMQKAWKMDLPAFMWVQTKPENHAHLNRFMEAQHQGMRQWLDVYPVEEKLQKLDPEQVAFVDVGGGIGHQAVALRKRLPQLKNKIIVQDTEVVIAHAIPHEGVEARVYNFFKPQPIQGARIFYLRNILHDYSDKNAVLILKNIIAALGNDSVILIDDMVLPDSGVHWHATQIDMTMMVTLASRERTAAAWSELMVKAGLKIQHIYTYTESLRDSILECVPV